MLKSRDRYKGKCYLIFVRIINYGPCGRGNTFLNRLNLGGGFENIEQYKRYSVTNDSIM